MLSFDPGLTALDVNQRLIDLAGQNISNANTPGYHREVADLAELNNGRPVGNGVKITQIQRLDSSPLDLAVTQNASATASLTAQLNPLQQIQAYLAPDQGSLSDALGNLFNQIEQLTTQPDDPTQRGLVLNAASNLAGQLRTLGDDLNQVGAGLDAQAVQEVAQVNSLAGQVAKLNGSIQSVTAAGGDANTLIDQRDALVSQLANLVDVRTVAAGNGAVSVLAAGAPLVLGATASTLQFQVNTKGQAALTVQGFAGTLNATGGQLAGQLTARNQTIPGILAQLDTFARTLIGRVDEIQATGLGELGPAASITGQRGVTSATAPLDQAGLQFPVQTGSLYLSVTNLSTGARTLQEIHIDPATQSLQGVASAITSLGNVQGVVNAQSNTLNILASPGYAVDFAGRLPTAPTSVSITGSTTPQVSGTYTASTNDNYTFKVVGSGTVGATAGLSLEVRNAAGAVVTTLNIGAGYSPGSALDVGSGVEVSLSSGTANAGDQFDVPVVAQPDTSNILTALGLNTFFTGDGLNNIAVRWDLAANPQLLNTGRTGAAGDGSNLQRLAALRDAPVLGSQTLEQNLADLVGNTGSQVQTLTDQQTANEQLGQSLQAQQQAVSGVDTNEELVQLLQAQRNFQIASKYISVVSDTMTSLVNIIP